MALITCTECGQQVSDRANECPHCGCPIQPTATENPKPNKPKKRGKGGLIAIISIVAVAVVAACCYLFIPFGHDDIDDDVVITPEFLAKLEKYEGITNFSQGRAAVYRDGKWGFINTKGDEVIPCIYNEVFSFSDGLAAADRDSASVYLDRNGKEVIVSAPRGQGRFNGGLACVSIDGKVGAINTKGETVFVTQDDYDIPLHVIYMQMGNSSTIAENVKGFEYDYAFPMSRYERVVIPCFINGILKFEFEDEIKYYNTEGKYVEPEEGESLRKAKPIYTSFEETKSDYTKRGHTFYGLKDSLNNVIVKPEFDWVDYDWIESGEPSNGIFLVGLDEEYNVETEGLHQIRYIGYVDLQGNTTFADEVNKHLAENRDIAKLKYLAQEERRRQEEQEQLKRDLEKQQMTEFTITRDEPSKSTDTRGPEWIQGLWTWSGNYKGFNMGMNLYLNRDNGRYVIQYSTGDSETGSFTYDSRKATIRCHPDGSRGSATVFGIDTFHHSVIIGESNGIEYYMTWIRK